MDKQKQIEEMAKDVELAGKCTSFRNGKIDLTLFKTSEEIAETLYYLNYRKIPENAVVLTREEFESLGLVVETVQEYESQNGQPVLVKERKVVKKLQTDFTELLNQEIRELQLAQTRKETAEKVAERLKEKLNEWLEDNEDDDGKIDFGIAEIELIGVKSLDGEIIAESLIEEICKEITDKEVQNGN